jgi:hypothetical protein
MLLPSRGQEGRFGRAGDRLMQINAGGTALSAWSGQRCQMPETIAFCKALHKLSEDTRELAAKVDDARVSPQLIEIADEMLELVRMHCPAHEIGALTTH